MRILVVEVHISELQRVELTESEAGTAKDLHPKPVFFRDCLAGEEGVLLLG
ncbi:hypothetical protein [Polyangium sp. y55x31]|uniref:hypothetical protein n=1 Tax=Polyangium sp. y55x31 TaxID=3042688 RepID=UPI00248264CC|nr:hypothetical protein [Polyangium sp. y55x31]MDI1475375.1 hypothetical protein [Polyangium sp. y55x31]